MSSKWLLEICGGEHHQASGSSSFRLVPEMAVCRLPVAMGPFLFEFCPMPFYFEATVRLLFSSFCLCHLPKWAEVAYSTSSR